MLVYIHVPFCARRCSYCDFAIAVRREVPSAAFAEAVGREWRGRLQALGWLESADVETVYFGGGTPSRLAPDALGTILSRIRADRSLRSDAELTLEANPEDVTPARADAWVRLGINRVSLGVQSFDPTVLDWMHRTHTVRQVGAAVAALRAAGIGNLSLDLIYGLPEALGRDWASDLTQALALEPEHLSLYALTVEPRTPLGKWTARGLARPMPEDHVAAEFLFAHQRLVEAGFEHYEVSNAARPGFRAVHNSGYWLRRPFLGLGPSAHGAAGSERWWNIREWEAWREAVGAGEDPTAGREILTPGQRLIEDRYLGLRTDAGVAAELIPESDRTRWVEAGWAVAEAGRVRLTPEGWLRLDALVASAG